MTTNHILEATDRDGQIWALIPVDGTIRARLIHGTSSPATMDALDLVDVYGPLTLYPPRPRLRHVPHAGARVKSPSGSSFHEPAVR
ncbi:hypothetical protein [Nocardia nova]|uniref:hypothetical protein n=1 Tax=Nocardia nova TaxID=37330 RepID=UPI0033C09B71